MDLMCLPSFSMTIRVDIKIVTKDKKGSPSPPKKGSKSGVLNIAPHKPKSRVKRGITISFN